MIDADHDQRKRGEIVRAEIGEAGQLAVVAVLDEGDWLSELDEDVFLSGTYEMRGKDVRRDFYVAREAQLLGASLTLSPANLDARPLRWYRGDLRSSADRAQWPISVGSNDPVLGRAIEQCSRELRHRSASRIVDLRQRAGRSTGFVRATRHRAISNPARCRMVCGLGRRVESSGSAELSIQVRPGRRASALDLAG